MTSLNNRLELDNNKIVDISSLRNLTNLNTLYLRGNPITDISPLKFDKLTSITY